MEAVIFVGEKPLTLVTKNFSSLLLWTRQPSDLGLSAWPNWNCMLSTRRTLAGQSPCIARSYMNRTPDSKSRKMTEP